MSNEEGKYVIFDSFAKPIDAEIVKGTLDACDINSRIIGDSVGTEFGTSFVKVVVLYNDLDRAIQEVYSSDIAYEDYKDFLTQEEFEVKKQCNKIFCQLALKLHPGHDDGKDERKNKLYEKIKVKYYDSDLTFLAEMNNLLSEELGLPVVEVPETLSEGPSDEEKAVIKPSGNIKGWLLVYVIMLLLIGTAQIAIVIIQLVTSQSMDYSLVAPAELTFSNVELSPFALMIMRFFYGAFFFYAAYTMIKHHPDAVFWSKAMMICMLYISIISLIRSFITTPASLVIIDLAISVCLSIIWLIYLKSSKQVNQLFPKAYQNVTQEDWILFFLIFIALTGVIGTFIAIFVLAPDVKRYRRHSGSDTEES